MGKTKAEIAQEIIDGVLTGGNRTKAIDVRGILNDILDSYPNTKDGGLVFIPEVGYTTEIMLTDNKSFTHKKYVDDAIAGVSVSGITGTGAPGYLTYIVTDLAGNILTVGPSPIQTGVTYTGDIYSLLSAASGPNAFTYRIEGPDSGDYAEIFLTHASGIGGGYFQMRTFYNSGTTGSEIFSNAGAAGLNYYSSGGIQSQIQTNSIYGNYFATTGKHLFAKNTIEFFTDVAAITASRVVVINASRQLITSSTTLTQLSYLDATSSIQTQLNAITGSGYLTTIAGIAAGGDLSGTYASPSVVWANGYTSYDARYLKLAGGTMAGNILFSGGTGIDTTSTGGTDTLNIGATNADVINYGNSATTHNFLGTAIYELQVNSYVTDKLMTLNYGGSVSSGIGVGFEIQENSVITGYFKTNAARTGFSFLAPANTNYTDFVLTSSVARTKTFQDTSSTIAEYANKLSVFAATTSAELAGVISDETGSGALVFATNATLVNPDLGTPASGVGTNLTGIPLTTGITGILLGVNGGTGIANTGFTLSFSGNVTFSGAFNPTFISSSTASYTLPTASATLLANNLGISGGATLKFGTAATDVATFISTNGNQTVAAANLFTFKSGNNGGQSLLNFGDHPSTGTGSLGMWFNGQSSAATAFIYCTASTTYLNSNSDTRLRVGNLDYIIMSSGTANVSIRKPLVMFTAMSITLAAGTTTVQPLLFVSGTNLTTGVAGSMEYNGTNLFFTPTGTTRLYILVGISGGSAPATNSVGVIVDYYGTSATRVLTTPNSWLTYIEGATTYKIPLYT